MQQIWTIALALALFMAGCTAGTSYKPSGDEAVPAKKPEVSTATALISTIQVTGVCFPKIQPDHYQGEISIVGSLFSNGSSTKDTRLVVLIAGGGTRRDFWDGGSPRYGTGNETTIARTLARAGYAVLTWDRPPVGDSRTTGPAVGYQLLLPQQLEILNATVHRALKGDFLEGEKPCDSGKKASHGFRAPIIGGHSGGGFGAMYYAIQKPDVVAGMFSLAWHNFGFTPEVALSIAKCASEADLMNGYFYIPVCPGPNGYSEDCTDLFFYRANGTLRRDICANKNIGYEMMGTALLFPPQFLLNNLQRSNAGPIKVFLGFGDRDATLNDGSDHDDTAKADREIQMWKNDCLKAGCRVTDFFQAHAGHFIMFEPNHSELNEKLVGWLEAEGLGPLVA